MRQLVRRGWVCSGTLPLRTATRHYGRGIPYTPLGTIQDFTASPRHSGMATAQQQQEIREGRTPSEVYHGPTITTPHGARPLFSSEVQEMPDVNPNAAVKRMAERVRDRQQLEGQLYPHYSVDDLKPPPPRPYHATAVDSIVAEAEQLRMPQFSDSYQEDIRVDPRYENMPDSVRAAQQSVIAAQSDSYGPAIRGIVPPPPPPDPNAPSSYVIPKVELPSLWYTLLSVFAVFIAVLAAFGK